MKLLLVVFSVHLFLSLGAATNFVPPESGCPTVITNYGCYCPRSKRTVPSKCTDPTYQMFDEEVPQKNTNPQPPVTIGTPQAWPAELKPIDMTAGKICVIDKFCEIKVELVDPKWGIIDWCITTEPATYHLQLLGPPHSPVCCDPDSDTKYTMMCMRRDFSLQRIIDHEMLISVYLKLLPRAVINFRLSLVLLDRNTVPDATSLPADFAKKTFPAGAVVKLIRLDGLKLDLTGIKKWEDLLI